MQVLATSAPVARVQPALARAGPARPRGISATSVPSAARPSPLLLSARRSRPLTAVIRAGGEGGEAATEEPPTPPPTPPPDSSSGGNSGIAGGAIGFGVALFAFTRFAGGGVSLEALAETSIPLDTALANGKPTIIEFYADWCEVCREMAPSVYEVEKAHLSDVNFVMLNIDNNLWAPELDQYDVDGIPHFVFLNGEDKPVSVATGRLPKEVLQGNTDALAKGVALPFDRVAGRQSGFDVAPVDPLNAAPTDPLRGTVGGSSDPRSHS